MARTILGLVNWTDGKVYFGDPPCDTRIECIDEDVEGCVLWTGDHAGQVKVTITQAENDVCNDTYYGCVNWATRKFQITIPDDCCHFTCPILGKDCVVRFTGVIEGESEYSGGWGITINDEDIALSYQGLVGSLYQWTTTRGDWLICIAANVETCRGCLNVTRDNTYGGESGEECQDSEYETIFDVVENRDISGQPLSNANTGCFSCDITKFRCCDDYGMAMVGRAGSATIFWD